MSFSKNLFQFNNSIFLIDWGFATTAGTPSSFQGTFHYAADDVLMEKNLSKFRYLPKYDLYSVVRCAFVITYPKYRHVLDKFTVDDGQKILEFYENEMDYQWKQMYQHCEDLNYGELDICLTYVLMKHEQSRDIWK
eukprot:TRINITY_DN27891_c0_g1_i1.p2 TRINITY_DN27891_c0_g1~~TRINITY_DN27891_c0_g1_i1.p2  ORF type:complete len:136 (-),score=20.23 TRINITY_DN27891_c0_g1_i1:29-436(-)